MFRGLRRRIRLTRYYSARRTRTKWSRAADWSLLIALLLSPCAAMVMSGLMVRQEEREHLFGRVMRGPEGVMFAQLVPKELVASPWQAGATPLFEFEIVVLVEDRGWPVTTSRTVHAPQVDIKEIAERRLRSGAAFDESETAGAIAFALERDDRVALVNEWKSPMMRRDVLWLGWLFGMGLWTAMLWIALLLMIGVARLLAIRTGAKKQLRGSRLRDENKCAHCGYDLRGLEFRDRCPECGKLAW